MLLAVIGLYQVVGNWRIQGAYVVNGGTGAHHTMAATWEVPSGVINRIIVAALIVYTLMALELDAITNNTLLRRFVPSDVFLIESLIVICILYPHRNVRVF